MSFDDDEWGRPVEAGEFARVDSLQNRLLIVFPIGYIEHSPTRFSQPGRPSDVIVCDAIDLDDVDEAGNPGKVYRTAWWRPSKLVVALRPWIGKRVLGRLNKGVAQNGMNAPWVISDSSQEPGALDRARAWAAANPNFAPSPFIPPAQFPQQQANGNGYGGGQQQSQDYGQGYRGPARQQQQVAPQQFQQGPQQFQDSYQRQAPGPQQPPAYSGYGPPEQYQQQRQPQQQYGGQQQGYQQPQQFQQAPPPPPPPPQPQYQGPPPQQAQYQQQGPPMYPVQGAPQDPGMLERMRAERARREEQQVQDPWADEPPF